MTDINSNTTPTQQIDTHYQVLARKYRSNTLDDLIGQESLVTTLKNAIISGRIAHAYIFTGIRGTGKTSTARILARALNCLGPDGKNTSPTTNPCGVCENCIAIKEDRHIDVIEMDAASNTGVDDMRELIEGAQYKPTNARYKVYIIDEVHMLSKNAFNALLKTLEEPPEYVKFIFATTDIRKVPMTILSRCQRFELSRVDVRTLQTHFKKISENEKINISDEALSIIAKGAGGSVRDGLSILDQVFANADKNGTVSTDTVYKIMGFADKEKILTIFNSLMDGNTKDVFLNFKRLCNNGENPIHLLKDLMEIVHYFVIAKIAPDFIDDLPVSPNEIDFIKSNSNKLNIDVLNYVWQLLVNGFKDISITDDIETYVQMLLIKIAYATMELPDLKNAITKIQNLQQANIAKPSPAQLQNISDKNEAEQNKDQVKEQNKVEVMDTNKTAEIVKQSGNDILKTIMEKFPTADIKL